MLESIIVTSFFPIKAKQNPNFYLMHAQALLSRCKKHIVLFTCSEYAEKFQSMRGSLPLTLIIDNVGEDCLPLDLPLKTLLPESEWEALASKMTARHDWVKKTESQCFSVPLVQLWLSKAWFVWRALRLEEFHGCKNAQAVFVWNDIGNCRNKVDQENLESWPSLQKLKSRGVEDDRLIFYQRRNHTPSKDLRPDLDDDAVIAGSTIIGTRKAWIPAWKDISALIKANAEKYRDGVNDQTIYYYLTQLYPDKYTSYAIPYESYGREPNYLRWYETFTQDIDLVNTKMSIIKKETIFLINEFLVHNQAKSLIKQLIDVNKTWWDVSIFPNKENKLSSLRFTDTLYTEESYKTLRAHALSCFNRGEFSYMFKRSGKHFDMCSCAMCKLRRLFDSSEVKEALSQIVGEQVTELNETFCSKYETGDYLSIHHDKKKGDYAFVFQLTEDWNPSYGGLLHFYDESTKKVYETVNPIFNSLTIFKLKGVADTDHFVSANASTHTRYAFTGWFSVQDKEPETLTVQPRARELDRALKTYSTVSHTPLCEIMTRNQSDKGNGWHNYTLLYHALFNHKTQEKLRVFELGLGTNDVSIPSNMGASGRPGASLYGWKEYFPNALIFGADIDKKILFNTERISTLYCDQTNPECIREMWLNSDLKEPFDIIIEDGLHLFEANKCFLEHSLGKLKVGGYYVIEDILRSQLSLFQLQLQVWEKEFPDFSFRLVKIPLTRNQHDNNLLIVYRN